MKQFLLKRSMMMILVLSLFLIGTTSVIDAKVSQKGYLGVSIEKLSVKEKEELDISFGVRVTRVVKGKAADEAGIMKDDIIQFFNDEKIRRPANLVDAVRETEPGTEVIVKLVREGKKKNVSVTVGKLKSKHIWLEKKGNNVLFISRGSGYLGIHLQDLNEDLAAYFGVKADEGVLILTVETESPAKKAGLKAGDVIIKLDKKEVSNPKDIKKILSDFEAGDKIEIAVVRHKKKKMVEAVLGKRAGHREIRIFKGIGDKKYFKMPHFYFEEPFSHFEIPEFEIPEIELPDFDELEVIWEDKIRRKLDKKLKRLKDILVNKLRPVLEFISI